MAVLHDLPHDLAPALLRRCREPRCEVRPGERQQPARRRYLGARLRRRPAGAVCAPQGEVRRCRRGGGPHRGAENTPTPTGDSAYSPASGETAVFSPNGDGARDALRISYRLDPAMDGVTLGIYRAPDRGPGGPRAPPATGRTTGTAVSVAPRCPTARTCSSSSVCAAA